MITRKSGCERNALPLWGNENIYDPGLNMVELHCEWSECDVIHPRMPHDLLTSFSGGRCESPDPPHKDSCDSRHSAEFDTVHEARHSDDQHAPPRPLEGEAKGGTNSMAHISLVIFPNI